MSIISWITPPPDAYMVTKIVRFPKDTAVNVYGTILIARKCLELNNMYAELPWYPKQGEAVMIRCEIDANASGALYGIRLSATTGPNIYIHKSGSTHKVQWRLGDSVQYEVNLDTQMHVIGWMCGQDANTSDLEHRFVMPFFDYAVAESVKLYGPSAFSSVTHARICNFLTSTSDTDAHNALTSTNTWAIRIYDIAAYSYPYEYGTNKARRPYHIYAGCLASSTSSKTFISVRSTIGTIALKNSASGTPYSNIVNFSGNGADIGWGITIGDLREITGGGYHTWLETAWDDGGPDLVVGYDPTTADNPSCAKQSGTSTRRKFAFSLKNSSSSIPLPDGWSVDTTGIVPTGTYDKGELIKGRKPKWSIWADAIDFGFYINASYQMGFNVFKKFDSSPRGSSTVPIRIAEGLMNLLGFDNYNTHEVHPPIMNFLNNELVLHIHNGAMLKCQTIDLMGGDMDGEYSLNSVQYRVKDSECVFMLNETVGGSLHYRLGNLVPWNRSLEDMENVGVIPIGMKVGVSLTQNGSNFLEDVVKETASPYLTSGANSTVKNKYRIDGVTDALGVGKKRWYLIDYLKEHNGQADMYARLKMLVSGDTEIDCRKLIPDRPCHLTAAYEESISVFGTSGRYRMAVDYKDASANDIIGVIGWMPSASPLSHSMFTRYSWFNVSGQYSVDSFQRVYWDAMISNFQSHTVSALRDDGSNTYDEDFKVSDHEHLARTWTWEWQVYLDNGTYKVRFAVVYRNGNEGTWIEEYNPADYGYSYDRWHEMYSNTEIATNNAIFLPIIAVQKTTVGSSIQYNPIFSDVAYTAVFEIFSESTNTPGEYSYKSLILSALGDANTGGVTAFKAAFPEVANEWWRSNDNNVPYDKCVWHADVKTDVTGSTNLANLAQYARIFCFDRAIYNNGGTSVAIPYQATVIAHIYKSASAPIFAKTRGYAFDSEHHVLTNPYSVGQLSRTFAFGETYWEMEGTVESSTSYKVCVIRFISYQKNDSVYTKASGLPCYVNLYKNGGTTPFASFDFFSSGANQFNFSLKSVEGVEKVISDSRNDCNATIRNDAGYSNDEMFYGLDGLYTNECFSLRLRIPASKFDSSDKYIDVEFSNS